MVAVDTQIDEEVADELAEAIDEVGVEVNFRTYPDRTVDEVGSTVTLGTPVDKPVLVTPFEIELKLVGEEARPVEIAKFLIVTREGRSDAIDFTPARDMLVIDDDSKEWSIKSLNKFKSGNRTVAYEITAVA